MRYSMVAAPLALAAGANAWNQTQYTTEVVSQLTTYCPGATSLTHNGQVYTVTEATTLTITDCPCTITKPIIQASATPVSSFTTSASPAISIVASESSVSSVAISETAVSSISAAPIISASASAAPVASGIASPVTSAAPYPTTVVSAASVAIGTAAPVGTASSVPSSPVSPVSPSTSPFTGAANKVAASGAGIMAVCAFAVFFL